MRSLRYRRCCSRWRATGLYPRKCGPVAASRPLISRRPRRIVTSSRTAFWRRLWSLAGRRVRFVKPNVLFRVQFHNPQIRILLTRLQTAANDERAQRRREPLFGFRRRGQIGGWSLCRAHVEEGTQHTVPVQSGGWRPHPGSTNGAIIPHPRTRGQIARSFWRSSTCTCGRLELVVPLGRGPRDNGEVHDSSHQSNLSRPES